MEDNKSLEILKAIAYYLERPGLRKPPSASSLGLSSMEFQTALNELVENGLIECTTNLIAEKIHFINKDTRITAEGEVYLAE